MKSPDNETSKKAKPADAVSDHIEAFRATPADVAAFSVLRVRLRDGQHLEDLAEINELHAPYLADPPRAAEVWAEAGEARLGLGQKELAVRDLRAALALDPSHERAAVTATELLLESNHHALAVEIIEDELADLERRAAAIAAGKRSAGPNDAALTARRAQRHRLAAEVWNHRLGRVDRALAHWQQAWHLEPNRTDALEAARQIYGSLGDDNMVGKLFQAELEVLGAQGPVAKRSAILVELGKLAQRAGDLPTAARHLEQALALAPELASAEELLAEIYASPRWGDGGDAGPKRASELFVDLGRKRLETRDDVTALQFLRRAVGADPYSSAGSQALEAALEGASKWDELDRVLRHRSSLAAEPAERARILSRRIALYERELPDRGKLIDALAELAAMEPAYGPSSLRLRKLLRDEQRWEELAQRMAAELEVLGDNPAEQLKELLELATIAREHLGDKERAAELLHRALSVDPQSEEAIARYADHFRERRDWRGLADLYEFGLDNAREAGAEVPDLVRRLEEIAQIAELRLGDVPRAIDTWRRIEELEPSSTKAKEALRRLLARSKMWEQLVGVLEADATAARTPADRAEALRRIAQTYRERQVEPRRAIALYEEVLTLLPGDEAVLKALIELYEREGDDAGLATTLRRQLEQDAQRLSAQMEAAGKPPGGAREWPVAKRVERLTVLRRLATMCETRTADVDGVVYACTAILEMLPGDRDALDRMERVLDKVGDLKRLEQTLEYHAASATGPAEKAKVLRRLARLAGDAGDDALALDRWEQTVRAVPSDPEALEALSGLYERAERWAELASVLERLDAGRPAVEPGSPEAALRARELERYAKVVDERLGDAQRATKAWQRVVAVSPRDRHALDALGRLHRAAGRWRDLAETLGVQIAIHAADDRGRAADLALERAQILEERLGAPADAIKQLEKVVAELDPAHLDAHSALRRLHEARGDHEAAVRVAEREMYLAPDNERKLARGLEIGHICRDRLGDAKRALQAFGRVLAIDPNHEEALAASADLHARLGDWAAHVQILERRLERAVAPRERRALMTRIASAQAERLGDSASGFAWLRRIHDEQPDAASLAELRRAAEAYGLWSEWAEVLSADKRRLLSAGAGGVPIDVDAYVAGSRELAAIFERRLGDRQRAIASLVEGLAVAPSDTAMLAEAERISTEGNDPHQWQQLLDAYEVVLRTASPLGKVSLLERRARVYAERMGNAKAALAELMVAFGWAPDREETRTQIGELAEAASSWDDVIAVENALIDRASSDAARVVALRRKAEVIEARIKDLPRAFRAHLVAFLIAPEDADTVGQLWRLARAIGSYTDADKTPRPEPAGAPVQSERSLAEAEAHALLSTPSRSEQARDTRRTPRFATEELDIEVAARELRVGETTQPLDISDLEAADLAIADPAPLAPPPAEVAATSKARNDQTMQLKVEDLMAMQAPPPPPRSSGGGLPGVARRQPPPPVANKTAPKSLVSQGRRPAPASVPPPLKQPPRKAQAIVRRLPLPTLSTRAFESPWDELSAAYEALPSRDTPGRLRWLYRAAEVHETGARDIGRAFQTLSRALTLAQQLPQGDGEVRARLHRLAEEHDQWDRLADLYETLADAALSAAAAADLLMEVAAIRIIQRRPHDAEAQYRRVLGMRPTDAVARQRLEQLYRAEQRWVELAASLEERTDPRLGTVAAEAEQPALLRELADIYVDQMGRPHDAVDALERLRQLVPEDVEVLRRLGDLYARIGRWSKVIEIQGRIGEVAEGTEDAREALRRVAGIYERELELPDRAIDSYRQLVASWPDDAAAWTALSGLYQGHARWAELAEALRRRAVLAREDHERIELIAWRAKVLLEWLGAAEEAVTALRHARTIAPDDAGLADLMILALSKAGRDREAAAILDSRIAALTDRGDAPRGDIAGLFIRLGQLRHERLGDDIGARRALDEALRLVPDHPTALSVQAQISAPDEDPGAFALRKLRAAEAMTDDDAKVEALMAAGVTFRDRASDPDLARGAFEQVLAIRPYHADAIWALAGLIEKGGDAETAARVLEKRLEDEALPAEERARVLTQLAALARDSGVEMAAERRLEEAMATKPGHLPAVIALADLYSDAARWEDLDRFLVRVLGDGSLASAPGAAIAELQRRLALGYEKIGREEDAYQTLLGADRMHRGNLLIKLALGENRYKARRWREAALHLTALASHEDADKHSAEVAQGLYHAALAEIRSLRPDRAPGLYQRALEIRPSYAPALQAMAEIAMEQGDYRKAADLLTRQATASEDPAERSRLFEALGDMAVMMLHDEERARTCYDAAVQAAQPLEARHLPLLEKLLERCDLSGDSMGAARTAELMAAFGATPSERAARYLRAANDYLTAEDRERALAASIRAVEADPYDLDAVSVASELAAEAGDHDTAASILGRCLSVKDEGDDLAKARRAVLWSRLGGSRLARGDASGAASALEKAVALAPDSDGATQARRKLIEMWRPNLANDAALRDRAIEYLRAIAESTTALADVAAWAEELRRSERGDLGRLGLELVTALGGSLSVHQTAFLTVHPATTLADDEAYRGELSSDERSALIADDDEALAPLAAVLAETAGNLWPDAAAALARAGAEGARRVGANLHAPAVAMWSRITAALAIGPVLLYQRDDGPDFQVVSFSPPIVVIGPRLLGAGVPSGELRFLLGRAAELARPERMVLTGQSPADAASFLSSLARAFGGARFADVANRLAASSDAQTKRDDAIRAALPVKVRGRIETILAQLAPSDLDAARYVEACQRAADRAGLAVGGDLAVALAATAARGKGTGHLVRALLAPGWPAIRAKLGIAAKA